MRSKCWRLSKDQVMYTYMLHIVLYFMVMRTKYRAHFLLFFNTWYVKQRFRIAKF